MDAIPNTFNYMVAGYIVFTVVMSVYIVSLISRWNNLKRERQMLEDVDQKKD
jgi:hypothetical protein